LAPVFKTATISLYKASIPSSEIFSGDFKLIYLSRNSFDRDYCEQRFSSKKNSAPQKPTAVTGRRRRRNLYKVIGIAVFLISLGSAAVVSQRPAIKRLISARSAA